MNVVPTSFRHRCLRVLVAGILSFGGLAFAASPTLATTNWRATPVAPTSNQTFRGAPTIKVISCPRVGNCFGLGIIERDSDANGIVTTPLFGTLRAGRWTLRELPSQPGWQQVTGESLSCPTTTFCAATFRAEMASSGTYNSYTATMSGTHWKYDFVGSHGIGDVSCSSPRLCLAIGSDQLPDASEVPFFEVYKNGSWVIADAPNPQPGGFVSFSANSCVVSSCTVVGDYNDQAGGIHLFQEVYNGNSFSIGELRSPPGCDSTIDGCDPMISFLSCPKSGNCWAVGNDSLGIFLVHLVQGSHETIRASVGGSNPNLSGFSCSTPSSCLIMTDKLGAFFGSGRTWTHRSISPPQGFSSLHFYQTGGSIASCVPKSFHCTVVGEGELNRAGMRKYPGWGVNQLAVWANS